MSSGFDRAYSIGARALHPIGSLLQRVPPVRFVVVVTVAGILALSGLMAAILLRAHEEAIADAEHRTQDFVDVLAEHAVLVFDNVDRTLEEANTTRARLVRNGQWGPSAGDRPYRALLELQRSSAAVTNLSWTDEHGDRLYTALSRFPPPLNVAERPYFRAHSDSASHRIYIGQPTLSGLTGKYLVPVTRRFSLPDGGFGGVTTALVDPFYFSTYYQSMTRRQRLIIQLALRDGTVLAREPSLTSFAGSSQAELPLFTTHLPKAESGTYAGISGVDGVERIISYKAINKLPLVISVSMSRSAALAVWYEDAVALAAFYLPLIAMLVGCAWLLISQLRQRARRQRELEDAKERLAQAQKLQALGTLVGGIAHEINNALLPIMTFCEMLQEALPEDGFERDGVGQIMQSALQIERLIKRVRTFSREEQAAGTRLDLAEFVARLLKSLRAEVPKNIELVDQIDPDIGSVNATEEQLAQVFTDLVTNAAHAIGVEPGRIEISARASLDKAASTQAGDVSGPVDFVQLSVKDDGPGIPPIVRERLFEPFFTTKEAGSGVGLGLYTARRVVIELGGYLHVDSEPGRGACFSIYLPRAATHGDLLQPA
ncbi:MAG: hypothetical protein HYR63_21225 [Proteobacteria bacterium]|nr:hypothetical protein [Pseudomonadota bacterium]